MRRFDAIVAGGWLPDRVRIADRLYGYSWLLKNASLRWWRPTLTLIGRGGPAGLGNRGRIADGKMLGVPRLWSCRLHWSHGKSQKQRVKRAGVR